MPQLPDDSHDYPALERSPGCGTINMGCFPIGFVAAFGGTLLVVGAVGILRGSGHGEARAIVAMAIVLGIAAILVAARAARRDFGIGTAACVVLFAAGVGGCFGASLVPEGHGATAARDRAQCRNNLKQLGLVAVMYASEHPNNLMPRLSKTPGHLMFENDSGEALPVYPEYLTDLSILYCPAAKDHRAPKTPTVEVAMDDQAYYYLGYAIADQAELEAFAEAYRAVIAARGDFDGDLAGSSGQTLHRLQLPEEPPAEELAQQPERAGIPLLIERPLAHIPGGSNVLYSDGHVEFIKMNTKWPVTQEAFDVLLALDALGKT